MPDTTPDATPEAAPAGGGAVLPTGAAADAVAVTAWGIERGAEFGGAATVEVRDDGVVITLDAARAVGIPPARGPRRAARRYRFDAIDGVRVEGVGGGGERAQLTIFLGGGDVTELTGPAALRATARAIEDAACALAEQTLALRALGSPRANPGSDHDRFFAPLLAGRRAAESAPSALERVAAFDAAVMARRLGDALAAFAAERFPSSAPDRRALEAELRDLAAPALARLEQLGAAAEAVRGAGDDVRFARWREWAAALRELFAATDAAWVASLPALADSRGRRGRLWRRVLGFRG